MDGIIAIMNSQQIEACNVTVIGGGPSIDTAILKCLDHDLTFMAADGCPKEGE